MKFKKTSATLAALTTLTSAVAFAPPAHALAIVGFLGMAVSDAAGEGDGGAGAGAAMIVSLAAVGAGVYGFWAGILGTISPLAAVGLILDNPNDAGSKLSDKIATYDASQEESENLAALFINGFAEEARSGQQTVITADQLKQAAPNFYGTAAFKQMILDMGFKAQN